MELKLRFDQMMGLGENVQTWAFHPQRVRNPVKRAG
jgi:hypothetical protein